MEEHIENRKTSLELTIHPDNLFVHGKYEGDSRKGNDIALIGVQEDYEKMKYIFSNNHLNQKFNKKINFIFKNKIYAHITWRNKKNQKIIYFHLGVWGYSCEIEFERKLYP